VTLCGSFRQDPAALRAEHQSLIAAGCQVLSPKALDFVAEDDGFVFALGEQELGSAKVERSHLRAIEQADFIWLHCPEGYIGVSAIMEIGFAQLLGKAIFASERPCERVIADLVTVSSPAQAAAQARVQHPIPTHTLTALQQYYQTVSRQRGWQDESAEQTLELLKGEIEELEVELKKSAESESIENHEHSPLALELADVQLYVIHLANVLGIDLSQEVVFKEELNKQRFNKSDLDS